MWSLECFLAFGHNYVSVKGTIVSSGGQEHWTPCWVKSKENKQANAWKRKASWEENKLYFYDQFDLLLSYKKIL